jgi:hypothetical protein
MTAPLHCAFAVLLSRCLPAWAAIPLSLLIHIPCDLYPEYTGFFEGRQTKEKNIFALCEICMGFALIIWFLFNPSWLAVWCMGVSVIPDIFEWIFQRVRGEDWDRPLFFFHANSWQGFSMKPVQCGILDAAIFSLILIGA